MVNNFGGCLAFILQAEGGWSDNPDDPGGCTMRGITLQSFRLWKGNTQLTCADLNKVTAEDASAFYHQEYWVPLHGDALPPGVDLMVIDCAVNIGAPRSVRLLQEHVGVPVDGLFGPHTLASVLHAQPVPLIDDLAAAQTKLYQGLTEFAIFGQGWLNRVNARHRAARSMAVQP